MCVNSRRELILHGLPDEQGLFKICNHRMGEVILQFTSKCNHVTRTNELPNDANRVIELCEECNRIRMYTINTGALDATFACETPRMICNGPDDTDLIMDSKGCVSQLRWNENRRILNVEHQLQTHLKDVLRICFIQTFSIDLFVVSMSENLNELCGPVTWIKLNDGTQQWKFDSFFAGKPVHTRVNSSDDTGRVFMGDFDNNQFLVLDGHSGCVLKLIQLGPELLPLIWKMCWVDTQPNLIVHNSFEMITCLNIE